MAVEEKKRTVIEKEARQILDKFSKALSKVRAEEVNVERREDRRKEEEGKICGKDFRKIMFENAPRHDEDFIKAERKKW